MKFKVGDKVKTKFGLGKIVEIDKKDWDMPYLVFHYNYNNGHNAEDYYGDKYFGNHCLWFEERDIELAKPKQSIHIYSDGVTTTAILKEGKKVIDKVEAICHKDDEFDFKVGAELAFDRLIHKEIKVGDKVEIVDDGYSYDTYTDWFKENNCQNLEKYYVYGNYPKNGLYAKVIAIGRKNIFGNEIILAIKTTRSQVYLIELDGVKKVAE